MRGAAAIRKRESITGLRGRGAFLTLLVLLLVLSAVMIIAWPRGGKLIAVRSEISRLLFGTFATGQVLMMAVLATIHAAGSMTSEKENGCFDFILTAPISPSGIVMGKLFASLMYIQLLLVATLPLASLCLVLGGISTWDILTFYGGLFILTTLCGLVGLTCSTFFHRTQAALAVSLLLVLPPVLTLLAVVRDASQLGRAMLFPPVQLVCIVAGGLLLLKIVNRVKKPFPRVARPIDMENPDRQKGLVLRRDAFPDKLLIPKKRTRLLPDRVNPVYEKEIGSEVFGQGTLLVRYMLVLGFSLLVIFIFFLVAGFAEIYICYVLGFITLIAPTFASNAFTQEKERRTLDLLLATPLKPREIVWGKVLATFRFTGTVVALLCVYLVMGLMHPGTITFANLFAFVCIIPTHMFTVIVIGLFFSMVFKRSLDAMLATYTALALLFLGPVALLLILVGVTDTPVDQISWLGTVTPFLATLGTRAVELGRPPPRWLISPLSWVSCVCIYLALSFSLLGAMVVWFRKLLRQ